MALPRVQRERGYGKQKKTGALPSAGAAKRTKDQKMEAPMVTM
jgi:hypothetical protein